MSLLKWNVKGSPSASGFNTLADAVGWAKGRKLNTFSCVYFEPNDVFLDLGTAWSGVRRDRHPVEVFRALTHKGIVWCIRNEFIEVHEKW